MPKIPEKKKARVYWEGHGVQLWLGHVLDALALMSEKSVHMCVTSPPYWGLRDYGTGTWHGGDPNCDHKRGVVAVLGSMPGRRASTLRHNPNRPNITTAQQDHQYKDTCGKCGARRVDHQLGSEPSPDCGTQGKAQCGRCFVCNMVAVFRGVRRVLRDDGTLWLNLGDTYSGGRNSAGRNDADPVGVDGFAGSKGKYSSSAIKKNTNGLGASTQSGGRIDNDRSTMVASRSGLPSGNLVGVPWRVALALQADGWILRQEIIWVKPAPIPEPVRNRCTKSHEHVFLFAKGKKYYYDAEAIKEKASCGILERKRINGQRWDETKQNRDPQQAGCKTGLANKRDVWEVDDHRDLIDWLAANDPNALARFFEEAKGRGDAWRIAPQGYHGSHFACVDDRTEALTRDGWKRQSDLEDGEEIIAYDFSKDCLVWQVATFHRYAYDGDMVWFDKRDTSQLLTPNHRCLVLSRKGTQKTRIAEELKPSESFLMTAPMSEPPRKSIGEDMASLVGWYSSEGYLDSYGNLSIVQSLSDNPSKVYEIESILKRLGAVYKKNKNAREWKGNPSVLVTFDLKGRVAWELKDLCPGKSKKIPNDLLYLPPNEMSCLLNAFIGGDGHVRKDGRMCIIQKDAKKLEQLQIMAIKLGYRAIISKRNNGQCSTLFLTSGKWLRVCGAGGSDVKTKKHYKGIVWCPNVASGFWLARRNGKPFITGNTFPPKLIEPMILAGTSARGCCADCGAPWVREVSKGENTRAEEGDRGNRDRSIKSNRNGITGTLDGKPAPVQTTGWRPGCECEAGVVPAVVLDPFMGSGTTGAVCIALGRRAVGVDLSEKYLRDNAVPRIRKAALELPGAQAATKPATGKVMLGGRSATG